ncbi:MAG: 16S rRNA (cytosine(1402)-N(4))-methyltransferase RsmH [Patescibacteria group bacterium]
MSQPSNSSVHVPVLLHEVIEGLSRAHVAGRPYVYVDGTLGGAGHAREFAASRKGNLVIIGCDRDPQAVVRAQSTLAGQATQLILEQANSRDIDKVLDTHGIQQVDGILLDLGISSDELDISGKGFSFQRDEPLLMTMGDPATYAFTAKDIVNTWEEETIADVIFGYGEERYARRIARTIVNYRQKKPIETTAELSEIIRMSVPPVYRRGKIHPATRTFQALRIAVNDELGALKDVLKRGFERLAPGGILAIISFHSLEDRIVKDFNKEKFAAGQAAILTKKPTTATPEEIQKNPRSRSAKLRILQKI